MDRGVKRGLSEPPKPTYAQSRERENAPKPSLPAAPPIMKQTNYMIKEYMGGLCTKNSSEPSTVLVSEAEDTNPSERSKRGITPTVSNVRQSLHDHDGDIRGDVFLKKDKRLYSIQPMQGNDIHTGNHSQTKIATKIIQKNFKRFFCMMASFPRCKASNN